MSNRTWSATINNGKAAPNYPQIWDPTLLATGGDGQILTGNWRAYSTSDISSTSVSVSGLSLTVGAVAITGNPQVTVSNASLAVVGVGGYFGITGVPSFFPVNTGGTQNVNVTNTLPLNVTGIILTQITGNQTFDTSAIVLAQATGNARLLVADQLLSGIQGFEASISGSNATIAAAILGTLSVNANITNTAPLNVTGIILTQVTGSVSASFDPTAIVNAQTTGNNYLGFISGKLNTVVPVSGIFNASVTVGNLAITGFNSTIAPLAVSGVFSATTDNSTVVNAIGSGNALLLIANRLASGISGLLSANLTDAAYVTGAVSITNTAPLNITGIVTASVTVGNIAVTGGQILNIETGNRSVVVTTGNNIGNLDLGHTYLPVSGVGTFTTNSAITNSFAVAITGNPIFTETGIRVVSGVNLGNLDLTRTYLPVSGVGTFATTVGGTVTVSVSNTSPINITGFVTTIVTGGSVSATVPNPLGVTGTKNDTNIVYAGFAAPFNFLAVGGRAVDPTGAGAVTGYRTGDNAMLNFNTYNGGLFVNQGCLDQSQDGVTAYTASTGVVSNVLVSGISNIGFGVILPNNPTRRGWFIQNLSTGRLLVRFAASIPTTGSMNMVLKGGITMADGLGASWTDSPAVYTGPVSVTGWDNSTPIQYISWEL